MDDLTAGPNALTTRRALDLLDRHEQMIERRALEAREALGERNFSDAATACHRAHQHRLIAEALRGVLQS
jgi:hypothetical protein